MIALDPKDRFTADKYLQEWHTPLQNFLIVGKTRHFQITLHHSSINTSTPSQMAIPEIVPPLSQLRNVSQKETSAFLVFTTTLTKSHSSSVSFRMELNLNRTAQTSVKSLANLF